MGRIAILILLAAAVPLAAASAGEKPKGEKKICRAAQRVTGSHMRKPPVCHTAEEWRQIDEAAGRLPISLQVNTPKNEGRPQPQ